MCCGRQHTGVPCGLFAVAIHVHPSSILILCELSRPHSQCIFGSQMAYRHASAPNFAVRALVGSDDIVQLPHSAVAQQQAQQEKERLPPKAASWPWQRDM